MRRLPLLLSAQAILLLAASCGFSRPPSPPAFPGAAAFQGALSCKECHAAIYDQWDASAHAHVWQDPAIRASSHDFEKAECRPCHSPEPVLMSDLSKPPVYREHHQSESVTCVSCHETAHGMAGPHPTDSNAPCCPVRDPRVSSVEACGICHDTTHFSVREWRGTLFERKGVTCVVCHMPEQMTEVTRGQPPRPARGHRFPGWRDPVMLKAGIRASYAVEDGRLSVRVENLCGHKFPGEFHTREFHVVLLQWKGEEVLQEDRTVLQWRKLDPTPTDNRLLPEEARAFSAPLAEGATRVEVRLLYKPGPGILDSEAFMLGEWSREQAGPAPPAPGPARTAP